MTSSRHGIVAVGYGMWFSTDGHTWTQGLGAAELGGHVGGQMGFVDAVTVGGPGFVAAGQAVNAGFDQAVAAVWTSPDGQHWTRVRDPALEPPTPPIPAGTTTPVRGTIHAITRAGSRLVAVGGVFGGMFVGNTLQTGAYVPGIWTSTDATHWARAETSGLSFAGAGPSQNALTGVLAFRRSIIAIGAQNVFRSSDGVHWQPIADTGSFSAATVYHNTLVAVGSEGGSYGSPERALIWTSHDAQHWKRVLVSPPAPFATYTAVATNGRTLVAVGYRGRYETAVDATVTVSQDGHTWRSVPGHGKAFASQTYLEAVTPLGPNYLVAGVDNTIGTGTATDPLRPYTVLFMSG